MIASADGSLTLFKNNEAFKTVKLPGERPLVRFFNGEIVTAAEHGKLTVMNEKLQILKTFDGTRNMIRTLSGSNKFIALGDYNGTVQYYDRVGSVFPRVSCRGRTLNITYRFIITKI